VDLLGDLQRLGVGTGDVVMPHASLRRIGARAEAVIEALDMAAGTVLMNVGPRDDEPFDALRTPVDPEIGVLAEVFRTTPGTLVTNHPEGRFGARGVLAPQLLANPPWNDYYGPGSPLERLVQLGGKVLRLGADLSSLTLLHYAEYVAPLPSKRRVRREHAVAGPSGIEINVIECLDDSDGIVEWSGEDYFELIVRDYLAAGRAASGVVGNAESDLFDAADLVQFGATWMAEHLAGRATT
jgi:aminoglycoside N3'-acetyltransferase